MYAQLGPVAFDLIAYWDGHDAKRGYEYAQHKVLEGKPKLQWTGDGLEEITIAVELHALYCNPEEQLNILYDAAAGHQAMPLIMGSGVYRGKYVLTTISQTTKQTDGQGRILSLSAKLCLMEWNGDAQTPAGTAVATPGLPVPGAVKTIASPIPSPTPADAISQLVQTIRRDLQIPDQAWTAAYQGLTKACELASTAPAQTLQILADLAKPAAAAGISGIAGLARLAASAILADDAQTAPAQPLHALLAARIERFAAIDAPTHAAPETAPGAGFAWVRDLVRYPA